MSATDELRRLLDKRGVEWTANDGEHVKETCWSYMGELMAAFAEYDNGTTRFACDTWCFTPEQAVEATLGHEPDDAAMVKLHDMLNMALHQLEDASDDHEARITAVDNAHRLLEEAATLGRGTCDLQAENDRLRERVAELEELTDGKLYIPQKWYQLATTENAKLREQLEEQKCFAADLERDVRALRELVRDMWRDRDALSYGAATSTLERMRELGVEVDG